jgi:hypothetical protein
MSTELRMVRLLSYTGPIDRVVVEEIGDVLAVCRLEEYEAARRENRRPTTIGFKRRDVIPPATPETTTVKGTP